MTIITINPDFATDILPYADSSDSWDELLSTAVAQEIDTRMIYTVDIIETWVSMGHPEPEDMHNGAYDSISDAIHAAVAEEFLMADYSDSWHDGRDAYAVTLADELGLVADQWDASADAVETLDAADDVIVALTDISHMDDDDAFTYLIEVRDTLRTLAA